MLKIPIKAGQITNLTDARYFAAREVNWLGFNLDSGAATAITPQQVHAIKEWIEGPQIVLELGLHDLAEVRSLVEFINPDVLQLSMFADPAPLKSALQLPIIKEIVLEASSLDGLEDFVASQSEAVDFFQLDFSKNNISYQSIDPKDRDRLHNLAKQHAFFMHLNDTVEDIQTCLQEIKPYGLAMIGSEEEKVGFKSFDELDELLDALEIEE